MRFRTMLDWVGNRIGRLVGPGPLPPVPDDERQSFEESTRMSRSAIQRTDTVVDGWWERSVRESWRPRNHHA